MWLSLWHPTDHPDTLQAVQEALQQARMLALNSPCHSPVIEFDKYIHTLKRYHKDSKGVDSWTCSILTQLPETCLRDFWGATNLAYSKAANPHQSLVSLNPLLGKPNGGTRTICLTPMLYRMGCRAESQKKESGSWKIWSLMTWLNQAPQPLLQPL